MKYLLYLLPVGIGLAVVLFILSQIYTMYEDFRNLDLEAMAVDLFTVVVFLFVVVGLFFAITGMMQTL